MPTARATLAALLAPAAMALAGCGNAPWTALGPSKGTALLEIAFFFVLFLSLIWLMRGTRGENILKGILLILLATFFGLFYVAQRLELTHVTSALEKILGTSVIALIVIFQPELRRGLVRLGENPFLKMFVRREVGALDEVAEACTRLGKKKVGALVAIEREVSLGTYMEGGTRLDAEITAELIDSIFFPGTALHDGAIVIKDGRIAAAGCLFPLTDSLSISKALGTRHRAAIGLSEETDAVTIVVSEETGQVSVGIAGELTRNLDREGLLRLLERFVVAREGSASKKGGAAKGPAPAKGQAPGAPAPKPPPEGPKS